MRSFIVVVGLLALTRVAGSSDELAQGWTQSFQVDLKELTNVGENPYFVLKPGYQTIFEGKEGGKLAKLVITVLNETEQIAGVETRIVEERETVGGEIIEVSRNFFAIHPRTGDVYYFGEDVDMYKKGKVASHEGAWRHDVNGAKFGLMMPAVPKVGLKFYQELAKGVAMDRAEVISVSEKLTVPAGSFDRVLKTRETTPLEMFAREYKFYAPGVGLIKDGPLELVFHTGASAR